MGYLCHECPFQLWGTGALGATRILEVPKVMQSVEAIIQCPVRLQASLSHALLHTLPALGIKV